MPDVLDPLKSLREGSLADPEPVEGLRARVARRRRRQRAVLAPLALCIAIAIVALTAGRLVGDGDGDVETVDAPDNSTTTGSVTSTTTAVAGALPVPDVGALPGSYTRVVSGPGGILLIAPGTDLPPQQLTPRPTRIAFGVGQGRVVAQYSDPEAAEYPRAIVVVDGNGTRELIPDLSELPPDQGVRMLLDAGMVNGTPTALVSIAESTDAPPPELDMEIRMALIDLQSGQQTDLGSVAGFEEGVASARLLPNGDIVFLISYGLDHALERRSSTGRTLWEVPSFGDLEEGARSMTVRSGEVLLLDTSYDQEDLSHPHLLVRAFNLETGVETGTHVDRTLELEDALEGPFGFCRHVEVIDDDLLCSQSSGPVTRIDLGQGLARREVGAPDRGTMTTWRQAE